MGTPTQFLDESPGDKDLEQAQEENKLVLTKKRNRVKALRNAIADLKMYHPHLKNAAAATNSQRRTSHGGFHAAGGGDGIAASGNSGAGGSGGGGLGGVFGASGGGDFGMMSGGAGVMGIGSQRVARTGAVMVGAEGVQDVTSAMASSMGVDSPASAATAAGASQQRADSTLPGRVVEVVDSSRDSGDGGGRVGGGGGDGDCVADGSGGVML